MTDVDLSQLAIDRGDSAGPASHGRRHVLTRYVLPAALIVGLLLLLAWAAREVFFPPTPVTVVPVFSTTSEVQVEGTPLFNAAGWIEPRPTPVRVAALAPGIVERLLVVEDQPVKAGQPVAELIKADAQLAYNRALAELKLREAELENARAALSAATVRFEQPVHLEAELGDAEAMLAKLETQLKNLPFEIRRAEAERDFLQKDYDGKFSAKDAVSARAVDKAESDLASAKALVEELRDRVASLAKEQTALAQRRDALRTQLELLADERQAKDEAAARVKAAAAAIEQANVAVAEAKLQLERMTVRTPIDGRVYQLFGHPGAGVGRGMMTAMAGHDANSVVTLYRPDNLQVRVDVRFEDLPKVSPDQSVQINNSALPAPLTGRVLFISSKADIQKNTLEVKVGIDSPPAVFKPEMLVDVTFLAPERSKSQESKGQRQERHRLYILKQLLHEEAGESFVWLADQSAGVARRTKVQTGAAGANNMIEITAGLTISSRIIAGGHEGLNDGQRIRVTGESQNESD